MSLPDKVPKSNSFKRSEKEQLKKNAYLLFPFRCPTLDNVMNTFPFLHHPSGGLVTEPVYSRVFVVRFELVSFFVPLDDGLKEMAKMLGPLVVPSKHAALRDNQ